MIALHFPEAPRLGLRIYHNNGGDTLNNMKIRIKLLEHNKRLWWLAKILGTSESTITRRLRNELPEEEQARIIQLIEEKAGESHDRTD